MPRDGSGNYTQPFPNVVDGTILDTAVYNGFTHDVETDLNTPRPVVAGGTGANNATGARSNIYAAPLDALAYNGMQVNGSIEVSQQYGLAAPQPISSGGMTYFCDGWTAYKNGTLAGSVYVGSDVLSPGLVNNIVMTISTAQASIGAGDYCSIVHPIEGYRMRRLGWGTASAQPLTIGFWTAHVRPGVYTGAVRNNSANRSCAFSYTQNVGNTGEFKTVTIPGCTDGTWNTDHTPGLHIAFCMAVGSTYAASSTGVWSSNFYLGATGQVNGVAATSDVFRITGVVVLPGIEAPSAARSPLIMRPFDQELVTCQRYYVRNVSSHFGIAATPTWTGGGALYFPQPMRSTPTVLASFGTNAGAAGTAAIFTSDNYAAGIYNGSSNWTVGAVISIAYITDARL